MNSPKPTPELKIPLDRPVSSSQTALGTRDQMIQGWNATLIRLRAPITRLWVEAVMMKTGMPTPLGRDPSRWQVEAEAILKRITSKADEMEAMRREIETETEALSRVLRGPAQVYQASVSLEEGDPIPDFHYTMDHLGAVSITQVRFPGPSPKWEDIATYPTLNRDAIAAEIEARNALYNSTEESES